MKRDQTEDRAPLTEYSSTSGLSLPYDLDVAKSNKEKLLKKRSGLVTVIWVLFVFVAIQPNSD